ncbi:MAG TPA: sigma-70 family RNA polymerase sigma factor [Sphingomonas sp.]|nr:sigma-70 family RNA polymerase sigma factor [Sphingomonas sp.]
MVTEANARLNDEIARVAAGDRSALRRVYDATSAKLFAVCLRFSPDRETAEDALQETYVKLWRRAGRFDPARASAITWLSLIARGTAIDGARTAGRVGARISAVRDDMRSEPDAVTAAAGQEALADCLDTLDADPRRFILAAFFDGYSYDELARQAAVPLGTMKSRIRRALQALKRCLDDG